MNRPDIIAELSRALIHLAAYLKLVRRAAWGLPRRQRPSSEAMLAQIREDLGECTRCKLHRTRSTIVFGEGNPEAQLMFIGEGPGADEDAQGRPFVGEAGGLLTRMIQAIGLERHQVYIANIVKCRPPGNRDPEGDEIAACLPFLHRQIAAIRPRVICALGRVAAQALLGTDRGIAQLRGSFYSFGDILVMPTYHPAYLLRTPSKKRDAWIDLQMVQRELQARGAKFKS
ncbi:MAG: uracil-DNA glycosylase [Desulfobacterota bacterium]|nr:uracil-DNA glycosylase [Thermodesulfobacteriota bacterium]